ncbi:FAD-dependent oxidoreductase [Candidatus Reidiella endopervernicosa]|uniref:FAD-dependent oxidoreductase n=1 Tax=Candidatus Reidiella endopervernicosa TaxID=2738883 RepID=A0A6N0HR74_9GAMM|nr:FAD-dependent oxidoreductase [Candidatus Reidiella endopervernicosa]QKQ24844.1 FAD-dependent oxidoreductase [Candidatus Reidiella endopervernicosa]
MKQVDVAIIGGGISGTALLYHLARHSDYNRVVLMEKYPQIAAVNSHARNNSQTLHCGDIETNYTLEKALKVQQTARMVVDYAESLSEAERNQILFKFPKMLLGVGDAECELLHQHRESLFLRKFVLGIQPKQTAKTSRDVYTCGAPTVLRSLRNHLFAALHNSSQ